MWLLQLRLSCKEKYSSAKQDGEDYASQLSDRKEKT
jgi:hypothetical protein